MADALTSKGIGITVGYVSHSVHHVNDVVQEFAQIPAVVMPPTAAVVARFVPLQNQCVSRESVRSRKLPKPQPMTIKKA
jgi:hypothetical protein